MAESTRSSCKARKTLFKKGCTCLNHDLYAANKEYQLLSTQWCGKRSAFHELVQRNLISERCKWVCSVCMDYSSENFCTQKASLSLSFTDSEADTPQHILEEESDANAPQLESSSAGGSHVEQPMDTTDSNVEEPMNTTAPDNLVSEVHALAFRLRDLKWDSLQESERHELRNLAGALGNIISADVYQDGISISSQYKDLETTQNLDPTLWLQQRNEILVDFLSACTGVQLPNSNIKKTNALVHGVEQVLYARNVNLVLPFSFQRNFVSYTHTNSKLVTQLQGGWEPSGSYTTVHNVVKQPSAAPECPKGDVHITFDNNQKVGLTSGRIRENSQVPVSICTSVGYISVDPESHLQEQEDLQPEEWMKKTQLQDTLEKIDNIEETYMTEFRKYRGLYINGIIDRVSKELKADEQDQYTDYVDKAVTLKERGLDSAVCCKCDFVYPKAECMICPGCGHDPDNYSASYDPYHRTQSEHPAVTPVVTVGDPVAVNPNGYANVEKVLNHIGQACGIPEQRKWTVVWSDGVPYLYATALQERMYRCESCGESVDTSNCSLEMHASTCKSGGKARLRMKYGNIVFRPGPGHIELNMGKLILSFTWPVCLRVLVLGLGFRTPRAQEVVRTGIDHHRTRQIIGTTLEALSAELLVPFVAECKQKNVEPSAELYFHWLENEVVDCVYMFFFTLCFTFLLAFVLYTEATRKNNHNRMMAARAAFAPLFYARRHPKYQELLLRDMCQRVQYPPELDEHMRQTESFAVSGVQNRGQGADFVHEELNKLIKSFLPPGVPTNETWQRVSRKANVLQEIKQEAMQKASVSYEPSAKRPKRHDLEVCMMRRELRSRGCTSEPHQQRVMCSLDGTELDEELPNFKELAHDRYQQYKACLATTGRFRSTDLEQVCVTKEERTALESMERKTKSQIKVHIEQLITEMPVVDLANKHRGEMERELRSRNKQGYLDMYYSVKESLKEQLAAETVEPPS